MRFLHKNCGRHWRNFFEKKWSEQAPDEEKVVPI